MGSSSGNTTQTTKLAPAQQNQFDALSRRAGQLVLSPGYMSATPASRLQQFNKQIGNLPTLAEQFGLDPNLLRGAVQTGGIAGFTKDQLASFDLARGFYGPNFGAANATLGGINTGQIQGDISALRGFQVDPNVAQDIKALQGFTGSQAAKDALAKLGGFTGSADAKAALAALQGFDALSGSQALPLLLRTAGGQFLNEGNPFVDQMIEQSQRGLTDQFQETVLPALGAQFAGTGSFNNSMRVPLTNQAARDLAQELGDIDSSTRFGVYNLERGLMEQAAQAAMSAELQGQGLNLQGLQSGLEGALGLSQQELAALQGAASGQVDLSAQGLSARQAALQGGLQSSSLRQNALQGALQGGLGLGQLQVSQAGIQAQMAQAQAAAQLQKISMLNQFGGQQQSLANALSLFPEQARQQQLADFAALSNILKGGTSQTISPFTQNRTAGFLGGAASGAGTGAMLTGGNPYGALIGGVIGGGLSLL